MPYLTIEIRKPDSSGYLVLLHDYKDRVIDAWLAPTHAEALAQAQAVMAGATVIVDRNAKEARNG